VHETTPRVGLRRPPRPDGLIEIKHIEIKHERAKDLDDP